MGSLYIFSCVHAAARHFGRSLLHLRSFCRSSMGAALAADLSDFYHGVAILQDQNII